MYRIQRTPAHNIIKSPWAVKRITKRALANGNTAVYNERLQKEAKILRQLNHPHVIGFRGMTKDAADRDVLALEICTTSLHDIIENRLEEGLGPIPSKSAVKVILDIGSALDYLHSTARILHGDLKAPNVLVNGDFETCKLCDFGVSLPLNKKGAVDLQSDPMASYVGTELWAAPEVFDAEGDMSLITTKTDIFSFGCTVYEMLTLTAPHLWMGEEDAEAGDMKRALNFDDTENSENNDSSRNTNYSEDMEMDLNAMMEERMGTRPLLPDDIELDATYDRIIEIYFVCTSELPDQRPSARSIIDELKKTEID